MQAVAYQFTRWKRQFPDNAALLNLSKPEREKILDLLSPIVELVASIESSINEIVTQPNPNPAKK